MANLKVFGNIYNNVKGIKATNTSNDVIEFIEFGGALEVVDTPDSHGGVVRTITAVNIADTDSYIDHQSAMVALGAVNV